ncbi:Hsp20/alpha crystallin family protein [Peptoniphilus sp. MSJ-1]|uniref:Hsp20/alpha crystallin family protein n=1 Tax=Peptoniphilus ovalis TaxID=2841503 RepID=A0ABS6FIM7_9FIRM|nr:Hsp20/alpha crystallin family protein [Peptoniphilus ovalis]MBU5669836.1 Hsp20/alpha crystallin family protein [Peptoniphilus ovalis]
MSIRPYESNLLRDGRFDDFYDMIDSFFNDGFTPQRAMRSASFKVDVIDDENAYKIEAELPGYSKDEIDVDFEDGRLTISAEKNEEVNEDDKEKNYIHRERKSSKMVRRMFFKDIDEDNMSAKLDGGILEITVPKKVDEKKNKKIEIE